MSTPLENEATDTPQTFEHFGREWSVPSQRHHSHIRKIKTILREEGSVDADDVAEVYLSPEDYDALVALDVTGPDLTDFANKLAEAMGMGDSGNSPPSSPSS